MKITKNWLKHKYLKEYLTIREIAKLTPYKYDAIRRRLIKFGIKLRNNIEAQKFQHPKLTKEWLFENYINRNKSLYQIAKELKCSRTPIRRKLKEYNIFLKDTRKGKHSWNYQGGKPNCKYCGEQTSYGYDCCQSCAQTKLWQDPEHRKKILEATRKGMKLSPNNKEKKLNVILNKLLPKEYKFTGDGKIC